MADNNLRGVVDPAFDAVGGIRDHFVVRNLSYGIRRLLSKNMTRLPVVFLSFVLFMAVFAPYIAPYGYDQRIRGEEGLKIAEQPSMEHPLGTTHEGYDVLSRIIWGAEPTAVAGVLGGLMIIGIGLSVAFAAGYLGGRVDSVLMRITDIFYSVPLIPFAVVVLAFFGGGFYVSIFIIGILLWRGNARVIRAQILQIKERPFILSAKATGASTPRIMLKHIFPNVAPMAVLFFSLGIGFAIIAQASLAFIGVASPFRPSWGVIIRNAYSSGYMGQLWTWSLVPGVLIAFTVLSCFLIGREFEVSDESAQTGAGGI